MKQFNRLMNYSIFFFLLLLLPGCELITDIFAAGFWVGIILVVLVIIIIIWVISKVMKGRRK